MQTILNFNIYQLLWLLQFKESGDEKQKTGK